VTVPERPELSLTPDDVWNGDGKGDQRIAELLIAIHALPASHTAAEAQELYGRIDNVAVIQGSLYPAGPKALPVLLAGLGSATPAGRPLLLDAIHEIASGSPSHRLSIHEREHSQMNLIESVDAVRAVLIEMLFHGSDHEAHTAADLLALIFTAPQLFVMPALIDPQEFQDLLTALTSQPARQRHLARNVGLIVPG